MNEKLLRGVLLILVVFLLLLTYKVYQLAFGTQDAQSKPKVTFKAKTAKGKLQEISNFVQQDN